jgi:hypothetical protein
MRANFSLEFTYIFFPQYLVSACVTDGCCGLFDGSNEGKANKCLYVTCLTARKVLIACLEERIARPIFFAISTTTKQKRPWYLNCDCIVLIRYKKMSDQHCTYRHYLLQKCP